jgi:hypothetical protein
MNTLYLKNITAYGHLFGASKLAVSIWQQLEIIFEEHQFGFQKHFKPRRDQRINLKSLSWQEILGTDEKGKPVTRYRFDKAFDEISTSYGSISEFEEADSNGDAFDALPYCRVYDEQDGHRTWYYRNDEFIESIIKPAILEGKINLNILKRNRKDMGLKP